MEGPDARWLTSWTQSRRARPDAPLGVGPFRRACRDLRDYWQITTESWAETSIFVPSVNTEAK